MWSIVFAFIPRRYFLIAGAALAALCVIWGAIALYGSHREQRGYHAGSAHVTDSVNAIAIKRIAKAESLAVKRSDSTHAKAEQLSAIVEESAHPLLSAPRHTPRIEAVALPAGIDTSLVGVTVMSTGEHFILPRRAAQYWATSDSLVAVAQRLMAKYTAANKQWSEAWTAEHNARLGADSLSALWRTRALNVPAAPKASRTRDVAFATLGLVAGFVAARHIR